VVLLQLIYSDTDLANPQTDLEQNSNINNSGSSSQAEPPENTTMRAVGRSGGGPVEDDDGDIVVGPGVEASVVLAKSFCMHF